MIARNYNYNREHSFKGISSAATQILRYLNTNPSIGATTVDVSSMSAPRTIVDGVERGFDAGVETGIRENSGTVNHALIGTYGLAASALLSAGINKAYDVKANKVYANFEGIDTIGSIWQDLVKNNKKVSPQELRKSLLERVLNQVRANSHTCAGRLKKVSIDKRAVKTVVNELAEFIDNNPKSYKIPKDILERAKSVITGSTTAESDFILRNAKYTTRSDLDTLLKSTFSLGKLFSEPKAFKTFKETSEFSANKFLKTLKSTKLKSSLLGVAIAMGVGASVQPINVWLTKIRTGKEGFVGVEGEKPDTSMKFKIKKTASALGFLAFSYMTIMGNIFKSPLKKQFGQFLNKLQFNGLIPSISQFKAVYGFTVASRLFSARGDNELRESATKDFLGYTNWLILGDFVQKAVASLSNKNLTNYDPKVHGEGFFNKIFNLRVKVKSHDEILFEELRKNKTPKYLMKSVDGKMLGARELIKKFYDKLPGLKSRIRGKNIAQFTGYLYSALVLGIFIPKLNIAITNRFQEKKKKQQEINNKIINMKGSGNFKIIYDKIK